MTVCWIYFNGGRFPVFEDEQLLKIHSAVGFYAFSHHGFLQPHFCGITEGTDAGHDLAFRNLRGFFKFFPRHGSTDPDGAEPHMMGVHQKLLEAVAVGNIGMGNRMDLGGDIGLFTG